MAEAPAAHNRWGTLAQALALARTEEALVTAGQNGDIQAQITHHYRRPVPLPPEHWNGELDFERSRIRPCEHLEINNEGREHITWFGWATVRVDLDSVRDHFGGSTKPPRRAGGRPAMWDWEAFWCELAGRVHERGLPEVQARLVEDMQQWFIDEYDDHPHQSDIRKRVSKLYHRLG
jgi:hypothetical protein